jgi:hypothetical protein
MTDNQNATPPISAAPKTDSAPTTAAPPRRSIQRITKNTFKPNPVTPHAETKSGSMGGSAPAVDAP